MKAKVGELKTHLSRYLRHVQETGETVEVCVREKPVAYLTPINPSIDPEEEADRKLRERIEASGLKIAQWGKKTDNTLPRLGKAGDGKVVENSVVAIRREKDW